MIFLYIFAKKIKNTQKIFANIKEKWTPEKKKM